MKLKDYRQLRRLSRKAFGQLVGVTGLQVWRWETGRCMPKPDVIDAISAGTGGAVTADDLWRTVSSRRAGA